MGEVVNGSNDITILYSSMIFSKIKIGSGKETAQQLRVHAALAENLNSVTAPILGSLQPPVTPAPGKPMCLSSVETHTRAHTTAPPPTHTHN